jgi:hypothetical protein
MASSVTPKPGSPSSRKKEAARIAEAMGVLPIEVMLEAMVYHVGRARRELKRAEELDELTGEPIGEDGVNHNLITLCYANAQVAARDAAPYIHPKLVPKMTDTDDPTTVAQKIKDALDEIEVAGGYLPRTDPASRGPNLDSDLASDTIN